MNTIAFVILVLISGTVSGAVLGAANMVIVEPYLDVAIDAENRNLVAEMDEVEEDFWISQQAYRDWQKGGQILSSVVMGISTCSLFGIVFLLSRTALPSGNGAKKALVLGGIMWLAMFVIPFIKYPANPPTVGDPDTIIMRTVLYVAFIAIMGFGAVAIYQVAKRMRRRRLEIGVCMYAALATCAFVVMPPGADTAGADAQLVDGFRLASAVSMSIFWLALSAVFGTLWHRFMNRAQDRIDFDYKIRE